MCCGCFERYLADGIQPVVNFVTVAVGLWMRQLEENGVLHVIVADNNYEDDHINSAIERVGVPGEMNWMGYEEPTNYERNQARDFLLVFARMPFEWRVSAGAIQDRCIDYEGMLVGGDAVGVTLGSTALQHGGTFANIGIVLSGTSQIDSRISELALDMAPLIANYYQSNGCDAVTLDHVRGRLTDEQIVSRYIWMLNHEKQMFRKWLESTTPESAPPGQ
jgi:hypothetical protein